MFNFYCRIPWIAYFYLFFSFICHFELSEAITLWYKGECFLMVTYTNKLHMRYIVYAMSNGCSKQNFKTAAKFAFKIHIKLQYSL